MIYVNVALWLARNISPISAGRRRLRVDSDENFITRSQRGDDTDLSHTSNTASLYHHVATPLILLHRPTLRRSLHFDVRLDTGAVRTAEWSLDCRGGLRIGLSSVLRPRQHSIGYMGDGFYRSKDPTNSIKVLKEQIVHRQIKHTIIKQ